MGGDGLDGRLIKKELKAAWKVEFLFSILRVWDISLGLSFPTIKKKKRFTHVSFILTLDDNVHINMPFKLLCKSCSVIYTIITLALKIQEMVQRTQTKLIVLNDLTRASRSLKKVKAHCYSVPRRQWQPTVVVLPGKSHGWRSLVGCSPWDCEELDTTERLHFHFSLSCIGEGNGNPLQCFCLENPKDGRAWWAAVYGVTQSQTRLKWLSSSSSIIERNFQTVEWLQSFIHK